MNLRQLLTKLTLVLLTPMVALAITPEQEKAFVAAYKKALETNDEKALNSFLYTTGAQPDTIEFFKMMQAQEPGATITSIELVTPTEQEMAKFNQPMEMPDGATYKLPLKPVRQLIIKTEMKDSSGTATSTRKAPVAEKDGKLVIPVPVPAK